MADVLKKSGFPDSFSSFFENSLNILIKNQLNNEVTKQNLNNNETCITILSISSPVEVRLSVSKEILRPSNSDEIGPLCVAKTVA
jgi:hypothetical protein